ncbi:hypothetical protein GCM10022263_13480 [Nocardioides daeguensis]|uniref:Nuclear transport factor 2 family protein n=1 Tax=Nocardioides daeguensis TaxID=908359 RepID=A0ABP6UZR2_9ACTN
MLAAVVGAIVVASLITAVASRHPARLEPGSPEAAVQDYLDAVLERDAEAAARHLAPDSPCGVEDLDKAYVDDDVRVRLRDTDVTGGTARVAVAITTGSGELIPSGWTEEHTFRLRRVDGAWLITGSPWPLFECGGLK